MLTSPSTKNEFLLEDHLSPNHSVCFNTPQTATQACLELLGTRSSIIPVLMAVTSPPDTLSAVLRAGGHPLLLDIDPNTLQMLPEQLESAVKEIDVPIVLFTPGTGCGVDERLLEIASDCPSLFDSRLFPHKDLKEEHLPSVFNVYDFSMLCGSGSVVFSKFKKQIEQLKHVRSGPMGHSGNLPEQVAAEALKGVKEFNKYFTTHREVSSYLTEELRSAGIKFYSPSEFPFPLFVEVPNAKQMVVHLGSYEIDTVLGAYPLYNLEEVRIRYTEKPEYPNAESLEDKIICIPTDDKVKGNEKHIVNCIREIL